MVVNDNWFRIASRAARRTAAGFRFKRLAPCEPAFDEAFYALQACDLWKTVNDPVLHYDLFGRWRGLDPNPMFDTSWYLDQYRDVRDGNTNPFLHYLTFGWREGRDPSPNFSTSWYLQRYTDVRAAEINPFIHFLHHGRDEGRLAKPSAVMQTIAEKAVAAIYTDANASDAKPVTYAMADFEPNKMLARLDRSLWRSLGNDPQLTLLTHVPAGFLRVRIEATCARLRPAAAREAVTEIHLDLGTGYSEHECFTFPLNENRIDVTALLFLENDAIAIRIDPVNTECDLDVRTFRVEEVESVVGIRELYERYCWLNGRQVHSDRAFLDQFRWANISRFVHQLSGALDQTIDPYERWMARHCERFGRRLPRPSPATVKAELLFSVLMPTYKSDLGLLKKAINSVRTQDEVHWELCIVDDGSGSPLLHAFLEAQVRLDPRIRYQRLAHNQGIASATNHALAMATGDFIALVDHDDEIAPHALSTMAEAIERTPDVDMLYSDEDKIDVNGVRSGPFFKPDWSPEFFMSCMYTCHLGVYRRSLVEAVGGFRTAFDLAQDYDLAFRVSAKARVIVHVPDVLYHWRTLPGSTASGANAKPTAELAARRAVQAHVDAEGLMGRVEPGPIPGTHRVKLDLLGNPLISIVIPTAARRLDPNALRWYVLDLLCSIRDVSTYRNYEIVLVENGDIEPALEERLGAFDPVRVTYRSPIINIAEKLNLGVAAARGEFVVLLNDDMAVITPDWLDELIAWVQRPGVVAAGAKLLFPDHRVQHAGVLLLAQGPSHVYYGAAEMDAGLVGSAITVRNYLAVTGACIAVRKADYQAVGGFDPNFRINYNDIDFCLKLKRLGRIVYTPFAKLFHYESVSKEQGSLLELFQFNEKWTDIVGSDPSYNVNLSQSIPNQVTLCPQALHESF